MFPTGNSVFFVSLMKSIYTYL